VILVTLVIILVIEVLIKVPLLISAVGGVLALVFMGRVEWVNLKAGSGFVVKPRFWPWHAGIAGTALGLFAFVKVDDAGLVKHELVHVTQWRKYGSVMFLVLYVSHFIVNFVRYQNWWKAYFHIPFEIEAYKIQFGDWWEPNG